VARGGERTLTIEQIADVLKLLRGSDSVELKLSVPDEHRRSAVASLGIDPLDAQLRQVVFFDTPDLTLNKSGVVVRARRVQRKPGDTVVKLRPIVPDEVASELRQSPSFGIELDAMPGGFVCSGSMKAEAADAAVKDVMAGTRPLRKLLTKEQRGLFAAHAPDGLQLDELAPLGPINVMKVKFNPFGQTRRMVAELWFYPDGSRILELSTKCEPAEAFDVAAQTRVLLTDHGIDLLAEQQTKTKTALEFFAGELAGGSPNGD
jgi:hypothetical protein